MPSSGAVSGRPSWAGASPISAGVAGDAALVYVAAGSGGLFRTNDAGMTWTPLFDRQSTISIGAIAVDPKNPKIVWVGTGESKVRNSVSFGDGLYKSEDAGRLGSAWDWKTPTPSRAS